MFGGGYFRRKVDDRYDKWIFLTVFMIGSALIVGLRLISVNALLVIIAPSTLMLLYAAYVLMTARLSMSLDRAGDNLYYLGMLFTLVSLSFSLFQVVSKVGDASVVFSLIPAFGVALVSTILGMFLRIFVQQFRYDPADVEKEVRSDLAEGVRALRNELYLMVVDFNSYRRALAQSIDELRAEVSATIKKVSDETADTLASTSKKLGSTINRLNKISEKQGIVLERTVDDIEKAANGLVQRIRDIEAEPDVLTSKFDAAAAALDRTVAIIDGRVAAEEQLIAEMRSLGTEVHDFMAPETRENLKMAASDIANVANGLREVSGSLHGINNDLRSDTMRLHEAQATSIEELDRLLTQLRSHVEMGGQSMIEIQNGLLESVKALRAELQP